MKKASEGGLELAVKVTPKASRSEVVGWENGELRIRIAAVPEKGEANKELVKFLAKTFGIAKSQVVLVSGETSRHKRFFLNGVVEMPLFLFRD